MPNLIKIGYSEKNPLKRLNQLYSTGVPEPFEAIAAFYVSNAKLCEEKVHQVLQDYRTNKHREFFEILPKDALKLSMNIILKFIPDDLQKEIDITSPEKTSFDEDQTFALRLLIEKENKDHGLSIEAMKDIGHWANELELEYKLLELEKEGLVRKFRQRRRYPDIWRITSLGVKFMIDNELVQDYILEKFD